MNKITAFTLGAPDSDDDMEVELAVETTNRTDKIIHQLRYSTIIFSKDDAPVYLAKEQEDVNLEPGETFNFAPWSHLKGAVTAGDRDDVKAVSAVRLMQRELINLGSFGTPLPGERIFIKAAADSDFIDTDVLVDVFCKTPDEDGDCFVELKILVKNASQVFFENARTQISLVAKDNSEIDTSLAEDNIPALGYGMFEANMYGSKSKLRDTKLTLSIALYSDLAAESDDRMSKPSLD